MTCIFLDGSKKESVDGEEVRDNADDSHEDAVADKYMNLKKRLRSF